MIRQRITGLDIVRVSAIFCVIAGHFFLNTNFMKNTFDAGLTVQAANSDERKKY